MAARKVVYGTPSKAEDRLRLLEEELTLDSVRFEVNFGNELPMELHMDNLRLMTGEAVPKLALPSSQGNVRLFCCII